MQPTRSGYPRRVDEVVGGEERPGGIDDLTRGAFAPVVDVPGGELLAVAGGATGLGHVDHVSLARPDVLGIAPAEVAGHRAGPPVVVDDQRIGPRGVEAGGVVDEAVQLLAVRQGGGPVLDLPEDDVLVAGRAGVQQEPRPVLLQVDGVQPRRRGG